MHSAAASRCTSRAPRTPAPGSRAPAPRGRIRRTARRLARGVARQRRRPTADHVACCAPSAATRPAGRPSSRAQSSCTTVGCTSGVAVDLRNIAGAARATVCVEARCRGTRRLDRSFAVRNPALAGHTARVRVVMYNSKGRRILRIAQVVRLHSLHPTRPDCPPECWWRRLTVKSTNAGLQLTQE